MTAARREPHLLHGRILRTVQTRLGLSLTASVQENVLEAADALVKAKKAESLADVLERALAFDAKDPVVAGLVDAASVQETSFFRSSDQLDALKKYLVEEVLPKRRAQGIRAWSAGCSTGEEAYTLALLLKSLDPKLYVEVVASDMNAYALEVARTGRYGARSLRALPAPMLAQHFKPAEKGHDIGPEIRSVVRFVRHNLVRDSIPDAAQGLTGFDLIACRNVLIYLEPKEIPRMLRQMASTLNRRGVLMLASTEYAQARHTPDLKALPGGLWVRG